MAGQVGTVPGAIIQEVLNEDLPESYDKPTFDAKTDLLLSHFVDMAVQQIGCILVPIYPTISPEDYHFILTNCEAKCIFLDTESLLKKLKDRKNKNLE